MIVEEENQKRFIILQSESQSSRNFTFDERLKSKGFEVLYMNDPIDEYAVQQLKEYDDKKLICVTKEGLEFDDNEDEKSRFEQAKKDFEPLCKVMKDTLGDSVSKVVLSNRIVDSPCVLVTGEYGWSANMERIMKAQALRDNQMGMHMSGQKTMEINYQHVIIKNMLKKVEADETDKTVKDLVWLMYDSSLLTSGFTLDEPTVFASRIHRLIKLGLSIDDESDEEEDLPELEDDDAGGDNAVSEEKQEEEDSTMEEVD